MFISLGFSEASKANWFELSMLISASGFSINLSSSGIVSILWIGALGNLFSGAQQSWALCLGFPQ
jgi:hypothetical protein